MSLMTQRRASDDDSILDWLIGPAYKIVGIMLESQTADDESRRTALRQLRAEQTGLPYGRLSPAQKSLPNRLIDPK